MTIRQHKEAGRQVNPAAWQQPNRSPYLRQPAFIVVTVVLFVTTLACGLSRSAAVEIAALDPLATLTRTPLPTLTLTPISTPAALAVTAGQVGTAEDQSAQSGSVAVAPDPANTGSSTLPAQTPAPANTSATGEAGASANLSETNPLQNSAGSPGATAAATPPRISSPAATAAPGLLSTVPTDQGEGWSFDNLQLYPGPNESALLLSGELVNNTAVAQEVSYITGTFYDGQGQVIAAEDSIFDDWPIDIVPAGGRLPFKLTVQGIQEAANYNLRVAAGPGDEPPRQDFKFLAVNTSNEAEAYCLAGRLQNPGSELEAYLVTIATLFNNQDRVISFGAYYEPGVSNIVDAETSNFNICVDDLQQPVTRYELQAWGR